MEVGPGPGLSTDVICSRAATVTALEVDPALAAQLRSRMASRNVTVVEGDATDMPFEDGRFSTAVCFTMLHHVPSAELQDRLFAEVLRVLQPGGMFAGSDSRPTLAFRMVHLGDTMVVVDPDTLAGRLAAVGFVDMKVRVAKHAFAFSARRPQP